MHPTPTKKPLSPVDEKIIEAFARLDKTALGVAVGAVLGLLLFAATNFLILKGGAVVGPTLTLLEVYFPGYTVSFAGSLIGSGYGFALGFVGGWLVALLYNASIACYLYVARLKADVSAMNDYLDPDHA